MTLHVSLTKPIHDTIPGQLYIYILSVWACLLRSHSASSSSSRYSSPAYSVPHFVCEDDAKKRSVVPVVVVLLRLGITTEQYANAKNKQPAVEVEREEEETNREQVHNAREYARPSIEGHEAAVWCKDR